MRISDWSNLRPIAHRGLHDAKNGIVENSSSAVQAAIDGGYGIEVDLQLSSDSRAMVFHDATLERLTLASGKLADQTTSELQKIDFARTPDRMMTLEDLLDLVGAQTPLFLEIKSQRGNIGPLEQAILRALATYNGPYAIMSFNPQSVTYFRLNAPQITRGIVADGFHDEGAHKQLPFWQQFYLRHLLHFADTKPDFIAYNVKHLNYPAPRIAHRFFNKPLLAWTVQTGEDLQRAETFGATPIFEGLRL